VWFCAEQTLAPTKLFYPLWWLEAVGFFGDSAAGKESAAAPPGAGLPSLVSHLLTAAVACAATAAYLGQRKTSDAAPSSAGGTSRGGLGVELPSFVAPPKRSTYQKI
jgi:hypothetical protein